MADKADVRFVLKGDKYEFFFGDFTGTEHKLFRDAIGVPLVAFADQPGLDSCLALVWLIQRRRAKGLPFSAVSDAYTGNDLEPWPEEETADAEPVEDISPEA